MEGKKTVTRIPDFDARTFINHDTVAPWLSSVADDPPALIDALGKLSRTVGMAKVASDMGAGSLPALYRSLTQGAHPRHETVSRVLDALGYRFQIVPKAAGAPPKANPRKAR